MYIARGYKSLVGACLLLLLGLPALSAAEPRELKQAIDLGVKNLQRTRLSSGEDYYWRFPTRLGPHFTSQYLIMSKWLGTPTHLDESRLQRILLASQLSDGSWPQMLDRNEIKGNLDSTIFNYWALKVIAAHSSSSLRGGSLEVALDKSKKFILNQGGLEKASFFTKVLLALNGNYAWSRLPILPFEILTNSWGRSLVTEPFSQWVRPHLKALVYLRSNQIYKCLGPEFQLTELYVEGAPTDLPKDHESPVISWKKEPSTFVVRHFLLPEQQPKGSWGGYSLATLFSVVALDHFQRSYTPDSKFSSDIKVAQRRGLDFIETLYFDSGESSYWGVLDDNTYWDSALALWALGSVGALQNDDYKVARFLVKQQQPDGGFPFGYDFWSAPDIDDTFAILEALRFYPEFKAQAQKGLKFVQARSNKDQGWGTFDKDNTGSFLLRILARAVSDSATPFDPSTPDVTGHALEVLGTFANENTQSPQVAGAIQYLTDSRLPSGVWTSRWAVNSIFAVSSVVSGLTSVGYKPKELLVANAIMWLKSRQNADGGFGEATRSYSDSQWLGRGLSTASQTAWALMALVAAGEERSSTAQNAVHFLTQQIQRDGLWSDATPVGTGHPGFLYMEYPSYPLTFPLIALGQYSQALASKQYAFK
jgi:squalene-hopene/tetraprenyl-beta-curcumene cyclase